MLKIDDYAHDVIHEILQLIFESSPSVKIIWDSQDNEWKDNMFDTSVELMKNKINEYVGERKIIAGQPEIILTFPETVYSSYTFLQAGKNKVKCVILREDIESDRIIMRSMGQINTSIPLIPNELNTQPQQSKAEILADIEKQERELLKIDNSGEVPKE